MMNITIAILPRKFKELQGMLYKRVNQGRILHMKTLKDKTLLNTYLRMTL